jgi:hypothetical protein
MNTARRFPIRRCLAIAALVALGVSCDGDLTDPAPLEAARLVHGRPRPSILLVHGAFVDALSWQKVIALLQQRGFSVTAVQNPLTSLGARSPSWPPRDRWCWSGIPTEVW